MKYVLFVLTLSLFISWVALEWRADKKLLRILHWLADGIRTTDLPPHWDREELTVVCMDCQAHIGGPKVNLQDAMQARVVSHGLCPDCLRERMKELDH